VWSEKENGALSVPFFLAIAINSTAFIPRRLSRCDCARLKDHVHRGLVVSPEK
jgi:hypothetical protein